MRDAWSEVRDCVNGILRRVTLQALSEKRKHAINYSIWNGSRDELSRSKSSTSMQI
jgi:hypothetical protein